MRDYRDEACQVNRQIPSPVYMWALTWVLLYPLLYFSARGMFSFDRAQYSNNAGAEVSSTVASSSETMQFRVERFAAYGVILLVIGLSFRGTITVARRNSIVLALPILAGVSTLWSQDKAKTATMALMVTFLTAFSIYLCRRFKRDDLIALLNLVGMAAVLMSYLMIAFVPSAGIRNTDGVRAWQGLFVHKNYLGMVMVFFFSTAYYAPKRATLTRSLNFIYMAAIFILIVMSLSRTAWLECALLILYFVFEANYIQLRHMERIVAMTTVAVIAVGMIVVAANYGGDIAVAMGKTSDMTGRAGIFEALYPELWKRPVWGFGYQAFFLGLKGESANLMLTPGHSGLTNAENGILQMWLELGVVGTAVTLFLLLQSLINAKVCLANGPSRFIRWNCSIIFLSLLSAVNGEKFMFPDTVEWLFFVVAYISLKESARDIRDSANTPRPLAWAS